MQGEYKPTDGNNDPRGIRGLIARLDRRLGEKQITPDTISSPSERRLLRHIGLGLIALAVIVVVGYMAVSTLASFIAGTPPDRTTGLPPVQPTPAPIVAEDVWSVYEKLTQVEARDLRTKENVLNVGLLSGGGVAYLRSHEVKFDSSNTAPWKMNDQPPGLTNLTVTGTSVQVSADGNTYTLNLYQGFVRLKDPKTLYLVDQDGHIWSTQYSQALLVPLGQVKTPVPIAPNPNLNLTY